MVVKFVSSSLCNHVIIIL